VGLLVVSSAGAQEMEARLPADPVESLRQALRAPVLSTTARDAQLRTAVERLRNVDDLERAVLLNAWRDSDRDGNIAVVDACHRCAVVERFVRGARAALSQNDLEGRRAALEMIAGLDPTVRGAGRGPLARTFTGDLAELARRGPAILREPAMRVLGQINAEAGPAVAALGALLHDTDPQLRSVAAEVLGSLVTTALSRDPYRTGSDGSHDDAIAAACKVLPAAAGGLADRSADVRRHCATAMADAAEALGALVADPAAADEVENWAAYQGGADEERQALRPLIEALRDQCGALAVGSGDSDVQVRVAARHALENAAAARLRLLRRASSALAAPPGQVDAAMADRSASFLLEDPLVTGLRAALPAVTAGLEDRAVEGRRAAIDVLEAIGGQAAPAAPALVAGLSDRDRFVRWSAARALGKVRPANADGVIAALAHGLGDADRDVRQAAATALGAYGPSARAALPALLTAARAREPELRLAAIRALECIGSHDRDSLAVLNAALGDADGRVRQIAAEALEKAGPMRPGAANALVRPR
jgi:HEAT repeat protein